MLFPEILYEDNHILVAVKPAGVLSQKDITGDKDMLEWLKEYLKEKYKKPGNVFLGLLHRLDRPVSGVMVFAKTSKAASRISEQIRNGDMGKKYRAIVTGCPKDGIQELQSWIVKDGDKNQVTVIPDNENISIPPNAKKARLQYEKILTRNDESSPACPLSLLEINLITGRSHQIRAQMTDQGFPLLGDRKYKKENTGYRGDICLESFYLSFSHPVTKEKMEFSLPLRDEFPWNLFSKA